MNEIDVDKYIPPKWGWMKNLIPKFVKDIDKNDYKLRDESDVDEFGRANVITSKDANGYNYLMLDLDDESIYLAPSSTAGHYHLAFSNAMDDVDFKTLVEILNRVGIIAEGNYKRFKETGAFALRTPWVPKGASEQMYQKGLIGGNSGFTSDLDALMGLQKACNHLGVEFPTEIYQQLNAKLNSEEVDVPDTVPVDWD